jgi:signal transduction histidine kinase
VSALTADEKVRHVLAAVPDLLRADRPPTAALPRITELARTVFGAERAGATLLEEDGSVGAMNFTGIPTQPTGAYGPTRSERGLFAQLAHLREPLRVDDVSAHPTLRDVAPTMHRLLGMPLRSGGRTIGLLYVADPIGGAAFTDEDEQLAEALGATVGTALSNATLLRDALRDRAWMRAANAMTRDLFSDNVDQPLRLISDRARELAEADMVLMLLRDGEQMRVRYARGLGAENRLVGLTFPAENTVTAQALHTGRSVMIPHLSQVSPTSYAQQMTDVELGPAMIVPLHGAHEVLGALFLCRHDGARRFSEADLETAGTFADHAAVSLELAAAREVAEKLRLLEDRNRIARDLHDHVIQRLYATGMTLQQVLSKVDDDARARIEVGVTTLDDTIRQIRNTILTLRSPEDEPGSTLGTLVTTITREAAPLLGFPPVVALEAPVQEISGPLAADLAACVREGLSNIVRHARAEAVELRGTVHGEELTLVLKDDGIGIRSTRRSGLDNLSKRVQQHGGTLEIASPPEGGAQLTWRVPLVPRDTT